MAVTPRVRNETRFGPERTLNPLGPKIFFRILESREYKDSAFNIKAEDYIREKEKYLYIELLKYTAIPYLTRACSKQTSRKRIYRYSQNRTFFVFPHDTLTATKSSWKQSPEERKKYDIQYACFGSFR